MYEERQILDEVGKGWKSTKAVFRLHDGGVKKVTVIRRNKKDAVLRVVEVIMQRPCCHRQHSLSTCGLKCIINSVVLE